MNRYFKGWYFKAQNNHQIAALIPAMHIDENRMKTASLQVITDKGAWRILFAYDQFVCSKTKPQVKIGESYFCEQGLSLNVKTDDLTAHGNLKFGPLSPLSYDIMGPFHYVPFMECIHSVFSMTHTVSGHLYINNEEYIFDNDVGYIEGDSGRSFPKAYAWTQCNYYDGSPNSIMLSIAEIPFGVIRFTGIIGVILWHGKEYRIATYLGAKLVFKEKGKLVVKQGGLKFTVELINKKDKPLFAPVDGNMIRMIHESLPCTAYYLLEENAEKVFEFKTDLAAFEDEYTD